MYSIIAVTNKHTAKLHHVGSLYILYFVTLGEIILMRFKILTAVITEFRVFGNVTP